MKIAIVAPGGCAVDESGVTRAVERLSAAGCTVHNYYDAGAKFQRFGGTDADRLEQLHAAAANPDVQVVMALRGSYGISRLLPQIDFAAMAASGKIFVGYSDFTAFHMGLMAKTGARSYAGPMICDDYTREEPDDFTLADFSSCLAGPNHTVGGTGSNNPVLDVEGTVWGGNLAMLTHLAGTEYFADIDGGILFVEDVNEHPYRVERMLLQLLHTGVLARQKALVLGDFSAYRLGPNENGYDFDAMLVFLRQHLPIPVLTGLPFGHIRTRVTIPFGAHAHLACDGADFTMTMTDYPTLTDAI